MAISAQQLNIILSARDKQFTKAMDRANKRVEKFARKSEKNLSKTTRSFNSMTKAVKGLGASLGSLGVAYQLQGMARTTAQLGDLAAVAGVSVERFQELSFAAKAYGIEQDKIADILKDVNDKFGDFVQTGAGPLKDFFEQIAPRVGITADAFKDLSSSQKLGAYIKALEEANVSQADMTFYLEAIANDATLLQRVYANNGAELDRLSKKFRQTGAVIDEDMIKKAAKARETLDLFTSYINNRMVIGLSNAVDWLEKVGDAFDRLRNLGRTDPIKPEDFDLLLPGLFTGKSAKEEIARLQKALSNYEKELKIIQSDFVDGEFPKGKDFFKEDERVQGRIDATRTALEDMQAQLLAAQREYATATNQIMDMISHNPASASHIEDGGFVGMTITAKELVEEMQKMAELNGKSAAEQERVLIAKEKEKRLAEALNKLKKEGVDLTSAEGQAAAASIRQSLDLWEKYEIAASNVINPIKEITTSTSKLVHENEKLKAVMQDVETAMESAFMSAVDGTVSAKDAFKSMTKEIIRDLYRQFVVKQITGFVSDSISLFAGPAPGSSASLNLPGRASGGPVQAARPYMVGEQGPELFVPQAHGRVLSAPQTKGALSGGGGGVVVNQSIHVETGVSQTVRAEVLGLMPQIAEASKAAVLDARRRGGAFAGAF